MRLNPLITEGFQQRVSIHEVEAIVSAFFSKRIVDSGTEREIKIPIVIDYGAVVDRQITLYREDHYLVFKTCHTADNNFISLIYDHNRFNRGLVCPQAYNDEERISLKVYLHKRFLESFQYYRYVGQIR